MQCPHGHAFGETDCTHAECGDCEDKVYARCFHEYLRRVNGLETLEEAQRLACSTEEVKG
jgi:hypothetical protein